ncbi:MAG: PAS domain S-box protein [Gallionella sp.]
MSKRPKENKPTLGAEAETRLAHDHLPELPGRSEEVLLHELQVHQIELEMQNEELRRIQAALEESRDRYLELYEFAPLADITLTDRGMIAEINLSGAALLGEQRQRLVNRGFSRFVAAADSDRWHRLFSSVLQHGDKENVELVMQRGDGSHFDVQLVCMRSGKTGEASHVRIMLTDITERRRAERLRRESEERFRAIFNQVATGIVQSDLVGRFTYVNDGFCEISGYPREELLGKRWHDFTHPEDLQKNIQLYRQMLQEGKPLSFEKRYVRKDGKAVWTSISASQLRNADSQIIGGIGIVVDISKRKQAEDALRKSSEQIADLYNHAPCGYHSLDKDAIIRQINDTELAWLGYTRDELVGKKKWTDLITTPSLKVFQENFPSFMKQGFVNDMEFDVIRKDGTSFTALVSATAVYDDNGRYVMSRSIVQDITARKRAEQEQRIASIAFQSQEGIMVTDASGVILRVNDAFTRLTGFSAEEVVGQTPALLQSGRQDERFYQDMWAAMRQNHYWQGEMWNKRKDGHIYPEWQTISAVLAPDGSISHYVATAIDITEHKNLENENQQYRNTMNDLQKLQIASQTAAAIAHELSQPLLAIASYSGAASILLQAEKPDLDRIRHALEANERQAQRAGQSIRELLEYLSIKEFHADAFDLNKEILDVLDTARTEHEMQFHAILQLEPDLPPVLCNRVHMHKVLLNLLHNGIEAMHEAGTPAPSIAVTVRTMENKSFAQVTVQDNGPGIRNEDVQRLFEPFFTTKGKGIGMGLAISRSLIEMNGGQLWVEPQQGSGATFHFSLPLAS